MIKACEFLLQREGDSTWIPVESPVVEILEGRYRVVGRTRCLNTEIQVQVSYWDPQELPPRRRMKQQGRRTNGKGLLPVLSYTTLKPGRWELQCSSDFMADFAGEGWTQRMRLEVLPQDEADGAEMMDALMSVFDEDDRPPVPGTGAAASPALSEGDLAAARLRELAAKMSQLVVDSVLELADAWGEEPQEEGDRSSQPAPAFAPLPSHASRPAPEPEPLILADPLVRITLDQEVIEATAGHPVTLSGTLTPLGDLTQGTAPDPSRPQPLLLRLSLRDPDGLSPLACVQQSIGAVVESTPFCLDWALPAPCDRPLVLGEVQVCRWDASLGVLMSLGHQTFAVTAPLGDILQHLQTHSVETSLGESAPLPLAGTPKTPGTEPEFPGMVPPVAPAIALPGAGLGEGLSEVTEVPPDRGRSPLNPLAPQGNPTPPAQPSPAPAKALKLDLFHLVQQVQRSSNLDSATESASTLAAHGEAIVPPELPPSSMPQGTSKTILPPKLTPPALPKDKTKDEAGESSGSRSGSGAGSGLALPTFPRWDSLQAGGSQVSPGSEESQEDFVFPPGDGAGVLEDLDDGAWAIDFPHHSVSVSRVPGIPSPLETPAPHVLTPSEGDMAQPPMAQPLDAVPIPHEAPHPAPHNVPNAALDLALDAINLALDTTDLTPTLDDRTAPPWDPTLAPAATPPTADPSPDLSLDLSLDPSLEPLPEPSPDPALQPSPTPEEQPPTPAGLGFQHRFFQRLTDLALGSHALEPEPNPITSDTLDSLRDDMAPQVEGGNDLPWDVEDEWIHAADHLMDLSLETSPEAMMGLAAIALNPEDSPEESANSLDTSLPFHHDLVQVAGNLAENLSPSEDSLQFDPALNLEAKPGENPGESPGESLGNGSLNPALDPALGDQPMGSDLLVLDPVGHGWEFGRGEPDEAPSFGADLPPHLRLDEPSLPRSTEIVVADERVEFGPQSWLITPQPEIAQFPEDQPLPLPSLDVPQGEWVAGQTVPISLILPETLAQLCVRLWLVDCQSRCLAGDPLWITRFLPTLPGFLEARFDLAIPKGCLEIQLEAITVEPATQRESHKISIQRSVVPGELTTPDVLGLLEEAELWSTQGLPGGDPPELPEGSLTPGDMPRSPLIPLSYSA